MTQSTIELSNSTTVASEAVDTKLVDAKLEFGVRYFLLNHIFQRIKNGKKSAHGYMPVHYFTKDEQSRIDKKVSESFTDDDLSNISDVMYSELDLIEDRLETMHEVLSGMNLSAQVSDSIQNKELYSPEDKIRVLNDFTRLMNFSLREPYSYCLRGIEDGLIYAVCSIFYFGLCALVIGPHAFYGVAASFVLGVLIGMRDNYQNIQKLSPQANTCLKI